VTVTFFASRRSVSAGRSWECGASVRNVCPGREPAYDLRPLEGHLLDLAAVDVGLGQIRPSRPTPGTVPAASDVPLLADQVHSTLQFVGLCQ